MIRRGKVQFEGQVHSASWDEAKTAFDLPCERKPLQARSIVCITEQPISCLTCKTWVTRIIAS